MKAYANPTMGAPASTRTAGTLEHIAVGAATRIGAYAGGLAWAIGGLTAFLFDLFGINLWSSIMEAQWVASAGWISLSVFMAQFGGLVLGVAAAVLVGGLIGALTAWLYNLTAPANTTTSRA